MYSECNNSSVVWWDNENFPLFIILESVKFFEALLNNADIGFWQGVQWSSKVI
jgi:hypothetical protein